MKQLKTITIALVGALTIIACKNEQEKINKEQIESNEVLNIENPIQEKQKIVFQKTLTLQNISFDIKTTGAGGISQLSMQTKGLEIDNQNIEIEIDGQVVDAEIEFFEDEQGNITKMMLHQGGQDLPGKKL